MNQVFIFVELLHCTSQKSLAIKSVCLVMSQHFFVSVCLRSWLLLLLSFSVQAGD